MIDKRVSLCGGRNNAEISNKVGIENGSGIYRHSDCTVRCRKTLCSLKSESLLFRPHSIQNSFHLFFSVFGYHYFQYMTPHNLIAIPSKHLFGLFVPVLDLP